jgi:hypothetical protein
MPKVADLVSSLGTGWKLAGTGTPIEEVQTIPNPMASNPIAPAGTPSTITQGTGRYYVIVQDPEGHQRAQYLTASTDQGVSGPGLTPAPPITGKDQAPGTRTVASNELGDLNWEPAGAITDVPAGATTKQPSPTAKLDSIDSKGNVVPTGDPSAKQLRDPATGTTINLVTDPAGTLHDVGKEVWLVKPDGSHTVVGAVPADNKPTQFNVAGVGLVDYDPSKPDGQRTTVLIQTPDKTAPTTEVRNGKTYVYDNASKTWTETNLPAQADIGYTLNDPNSRYIKFFDKQGQLISQTDKGEDWKPPVQVQPGSAPAADQVNAKIPTFNPQTGALEFIDNQNQVKASDATSELAKQLGVKVAAGSMSEDQAQKVITAAINTMNAQTSRMNAQASQDQTATTAAGDILSNTRGNAQTGAGLLQQRVQAATGTLQSILGNALQNKNITSIPGDVGANLVGGLGAWTADLMGGQSTMDSAARLVQQADPSSNLADPTTQSAIATLKQMLDKHQELTGAPHPAVVATQAAQQTQQQGGLTTPNTVDPAQQAAQQQLQQQIQLAQQQQAMGFQAPPAQVPGQNYGAGTAYTGGVPPWQQGWTPPGASYSYPGPAPWAAPPGPSIPTFIAPAAAPVLASSG